MFEDTNGKRLLGEAVYLDGVMLLQLDYHMQGLVRERLLVAFHWWRGPSMLLSSSKICDLCRSTGFTKGGVLPPSYPIEFLNRIRIPMHFIEKLIGRSRSDDVYLQMPHYPDAGHRAVALATRAAMPIIFLFFVPNVLAADEFIMREIVGKFFFDNWVVPYFTGIDFLCAYWVSVR
jgi:WASH complex subunit strumpellin